MRTTFTPDPDIAGKIKAIVKKTGKSMREVVNDLLRVALQGELNQSIAQERFRVKPQSLGLKAGIDPRKLNSLVDELEQDDFILAKNKNDNP